METVYVIATKRSSQHTLWNYGQLDYEIQIMNALLFGEGANQRTTVKKWIAYEEESFLILRGRETLDKIQGHEQQDNELPTLNKTIPVLPYAVHKGIADPNPIKVQQNNTYIFMKPHGYVR